MATSKLFPTAIENPYKFETSVSKNSNRNSMPSISHRITDESLLGKLKKNTQLRIPVADGSQKTRAPRKNQPEKAPRFAPYQRETCHRTITEKPELDEDAQYIVDNPDEPLPDDIEALRRVRPQIANLRNYYSDQNDYKTALELTKIVTRIENTLTDQENLFMNVDNVRNMLNRHQELQSIVNLFLEDWNKAFDQFLQMTENDCEVLQQQFQKEIEEYDSKKPETIDMKYKRSPKLLSLREQETRYALSHDYKKAGSIQKIADEREAQEAQEAYDKTYQAFLTNRKRLQAQQKQRMENFLNHAESIRRSMIASRDKSIQGYLKRMNILDEQIDQNCEALNMKDEDAVAEVQESRKQFILEEEAKNPISQFRAGQAYIRIREKQEDNQVYEEEEEQYNENQQMNEEEQENEGNDEQQEIQDE